jgi:hypothetical protein
VASLLGQPVNINLGTNLDTQSALSGVTHALSPVTTPLAPVTTAVGNAVNNTLNGVGSATGGW